MNTENHKIIKWCHVAFDSKPSNELESAISEMIDIAREKINEPNKEYYIISLKHTQKGDKYITLWRAYNSGYCYAQDQAGKYSEIIENYHNCKGDSLPIEVDYLNVFFINSDIFSKNQVKKCIPNCKQVWDTLKLKMTKNGLVQMHT